MNICRSKRLVPLALLMGIAASLAGKDKLREWVTGTVVDVSAVQAATDYTIQVHNRLYVLLPDPRRSAKLAETLYSISGWPGGWVSLSEPIPANIGELVTITLLGSKAWVLGASGKAYPCRVLRQTFASRPPPTQPVSDQAVPLSRREIDPADRPTLRRDPVTEPISDPVNKQPTQPAPTRIEQALPPLVRNYDLPPSLIYKREAEYSWEAREAGIEGTVLLWLTVGIDGAPHDIRVVLSVGYGLDEKAVDCVGAWHFRPASKDGRPVATDAQIEVNYRMADATEKPPSHK